ncbi:FadR family transcriptional regulator [Saccharopolyspora erythraea]|uniref:FadR/GntR family transcriptional regulator n=1 Tax=Saccharopolyspora erythraea TaxID=1836 RepID=UPI001BAD2051|nr:FadR/GntR family transcriptional regulator [Saccharopolyspora erythraea]QUH04032.1 FadR family transcriptional regulator [Saccharopolyspora erythraea]
MSSETSPWTPVRQGSVSDLIAQRILEVISSEQLRPGDRLPPERALASMLGASRPSLREALRTLKVGGFVDIRHGAGVFVADPSTTRTLREAMASEEMSLTELFDMREVLEVPAAGWAAQNQDAERLALVEEAFQRLDEASRADPVDWEKLRDLDAAFHLRIVEAAGNRFLSRTQGVLQEILAQGMETTLQMPGRLEKSRQEHTRIRDAVIAGDSVAARRRAKAHIEAARRAALARVRGESAPLGDGSLGQAHPEASSGHDGGDGR